MNTLQTPPGECVHSTVPAIDFFFDFISPYGWIGAEHVGKLAHRFDRIVNWRPFLLRIIVKDVMKAEPPLDIPLKGAYLLRDLKRSARYHGLAISEAARFGFNSTHAARAVVWTRSASPDKVEALVLALYRAHWSNGRDISEPETVLDVAEELGLSRTGAQSAIEDALVKEAFRAEVANAIELGVFGSPTFVVDGELFWGADRLPMLEAWLEQGGW